MLWPTRSSTARSARPEPIFLGCACQAPRQASRWDGLSCQTNFDSFALILCRIGYNEQASFCVTSGEISLTRTDRIRVECCTFGALQFFMGAIPTHSHLIADPCCAALRQSLVGNSSRPAPVSVRLCEVLIRCKATHGRGIARATERKWYE